MPPSPNRPLSPADRPAAGPQSPNVPRAEMDELKLKHRAELDAAKRDNARTLNDLMEHFDRREEKARQAHQEELARKTSEMDETKKRYEDRITQLQRSFEKERTDTTARSASVRSLRDREVSALRKKHLEQTESFKAHEQALRINYETMTQKMRADHGDELTLTRAEFDLRRRQLEEEVAHLVAELKQKTTELEQAQKQHDPLTAECDRLRRELEQANKRLQAQEEYHRSRAQHQADEFSAHEQAQQKEWRSEKESLIRDLQAAQAQLRSQTTYWDKTVQEVHANAEFQMAEERNRSSKALTEQQRRHQAELERTTSTLLRRIHVLEAAMVDSSSDPSWLFSESSLREKYQRLKLSVEIITMSGNLGLSAQRLKAANVTHIDPTGLLRREGMSRLPLLLSSLIWASLLDNFFSAPFGFGALGPEGSEGSKALFGLYCTWQKLLDERFTGYYNPAVPESEDGTTEQEQADGQSEQDGQPQQDVDFEPFYRDRRAEAWRVATFQSILAAVSSVTTRDALSGPKGAARFVAERRTRATQHIHTLLRSVVGQSEFDLPSEIRDKVEEAVQVASELAVEFGALRAKVCFGMPGPGDEVEIGAEFVDCLDGDDGRGEAVTVELAVSPALFAIGDGKEDLTTRSCLVLGEVYAAKAQR